MSFLIVFVAHSALDVLLPAVPGGFGVTVFFFLSGFLITTLMRVEREKTGTISIRNFYLRRALRILPPFYLVLVIATVLTGLRVLPGYLQPGVVAAQALHVSNYWFIVRGYTGSPAGTVPYWSLAVEEHFYLVFPLLYLTLIRRRISDRDQGKVFWALCALVCAWRCILVFGFGVSEDRTYMGSDTRVDSILFGCALAVTMNPVFDDATGAEWVWKWLLLPAGVALLMFTFMYRAPWFRETLRYSLQGIALTPLFVSAIRFPKWLPFRLLNVRPVAFMGALSYTLYLSHQAVLMAVYRWFPLLSRTGKAALAFVVAFGIALLVHRFVEKPCARMRKELAARALNVRAVAIR